MSDDPSSDEVSIDAQHLYQIAGRGDLSAVHRVVIKAGTSIVTTEDGYPCLSRLSYVVEAASKLWLLGKEVIIVSSGAVGVGRQRMRRQKVFRKQEDDVESNDDQSLGPGLVRSNSRDFNTGEELNIKSELSRSTSKEMLEKMDKTYPKKVKKSYDSACAAAGQMGLISLYDTMFRSFDMSTSQLLLTCYDFMDHSRKTNIEHVLTQLLAVGIVPILNENDAVSANQGYNTFGRGFSDNDSLAGGVASAVKADLLILLTDVDGCYDLPPSDPTAQRISVYDTTSTFKEGDKSDQGRGGMAAKVDAAVTACKSGVKAVVIASGHSADTVEAVMAGQDRGTLFLASRMDDSQALSMTDDEGMWSNDAPVPVDGDLNNGSNAVNEMPVITEAPASMESGKAEAMAQECREAGRNMQALSSSEREQILMNIAQEIDDRQDEILAVNAKDVEKAQRGESGTISLPNLKRLQLTVEKLQVLSAGIRSISGQEEPIGALESRTELTEGLVLDKISCPIGVLLVIFESRPDCLPQIAALAIRSANGLLLKGGKEAELSNAVLADLISGVIERTTQGKVSGAAISLVKSREEIKSLLALDEYIDLCIPRGSGSMVKYIQENTRMPVMGHAEGICHIYVDSEASLEKACRIVVDAKIDYPSACNAVETLLLHRNLLKPTKAINGYAIRVSPAQAIISHLVEAGVEVNGSEEAVRLNLTTTLNLDFKTEYGALGITVHVVDDMESAISHIHKFGSGHTESIITENAAKAEAFLSKVDGACVMHNASTRFADGYRFGLGAEVGISTGRIHARGPVGVEGLLTSKWLLRSSVKTGHTVADFATKQPEERRLQYTHRNLM